MFLELKGFTPNANSSTLCISKPSALFLVLALTPDLVFLVLPGVGEARYDGGDSDGGGDLTGIDHDEQLHQVVVDLSGPTLDDVDIFATDRLTNLNTVLYINRQGLL